MTGRRGYHSGSRKFHISGGSAMCVSASHTVLIALLTSPGSIHDSTGSGAFRSFRGSMGPRPGERGGQVEEVDGIADHHAVGLVGGQAPEVTRDHVHGARPLRVLVREVGGPQEGR